MIGSRSALRTEYADGVAVVTLSRPERLNALDDLLQLDELPRAFEQIGNDASIRSVVITGAGRAFCAGADLESSGFDAPSVEASIEFIGRAQSAVVALANLPQPSIAAVNGVAVGAGLGLALACDIRVGSSDARVGARFASMGLLPDFGVSYFLPRVVGYSRSVEILFAEELIGAERAREYGLFNMVEEDAVGAARALAEGLATLPPSAVQNTLRGLKLSMSASMEECILEIEVEGQARQIHSEETRSVIEAWRHQVLDGGE